MKKNRGKRTFIKITKNNFIEQFNYEIINEMKLFND